MRAARGHTGRRAAFLGAGFASLAWIVSCSPYRVPIAACPVRSASGDVVRVQYLGVGGFLLEYEDATVLTAPLYSNPGLVEVGFDHAVRPDVERIDRLFPERGRQAQAILVGHAHYDHLLDVPYIARSKAQGATVFGNDSAVNLVKAVDPSLADRLRSVETDAGTSESEGRWIPISRHARFMPFVSEHTMQARPGVLSLRVPLLLWRGEFEAGSAAPRSASDWPQGRVLAYLVDFLDDDGQPVFRVYYQDSGTVGPAGLVPRSLVDAKAVDLALLCVGGDLDSLPRHPNEILQNLQHPRFVVLNHWEDFFLPQDVDEQLDGKVQELPTRHTWTFLKRLRKQGYREGRDSWLPCPTRSVFELATSRD